MLRERLGIVTQDTRLFSGTIRDNVALFDAECLHPTSKRRACARCWPTTIDAMPMGYDTMLADGGSSLSGGQRQRLSLARALVRNPSVLILDEATSALDAVTEREVQNQLRNLRCTRMIVAHRLSTMIEADKIIVLDKGHVVGIGRHAELLVTCPAYRTLVRSQADVSGNPLAVPLPAGVRTPPPALPANAGKRAPHSDETMIVDGVVVQIEYGDVANA